MAAFCSKCGAQLEGNERFCVKCGNDVTGAAAAPLAAAAPAPVYAAPPPPPPGNAPPGAIPFVAPPPGRVPMSMAMPPPAPAHKSGMLWLVIIAALALGGWYYYKHTPQSVTPPATAPGQQPGTQPAPQPGGAPPQQPPMQPAGGPGQQPEGGPGQQPGGAPGQPPAQQPGGGPGGNPGQPPAQPPAQPGGPGAAPGGGGNNAALVQQQQFAGRWVPQNGNVEVEDAQWRNASQVNLQSASLMCVQYASTGIVIYQMTTVLNGPTAPGATSSFPPFAMGAIQQGMAKVQCGIVAVTPAQ